MLLLVFGGLATAAMLTRGRTREVSVTHEEPPPAKVHVNKAGIAELSALPGIGAKKAEKIIAPANTRPLKISINWPKPPAASPPPTSIA